MAEDQRYQAASPRLHEHIRELLDRITSLRNDLHAAIDSLDAYFGMLERLPILLRDTDDPPEEWLKRQLGDLVWEDEDGPTK